MSLQTNFTFRANSKTTVSVPNLLEESQNLFEYAHDYKRFAEAIDHLFAMMLLHNDERMLNDMSIYIEDFAALQRFFRNIHEKTIITNKSPN